MIIKLKAGLGNQMFQYAFGRILQIEYGIEDVYFDFSYISNFRKKFKLSSIEGLNTIYNTADIDEIKMYLASKTFPHTLRYRAAVFFDKSLHKGYYFEKDRGYVEVQNLLKYKYLDGYWQSYKYVESIRVQLLKEFESKEPLSEISNIYISNLKSRNAVMVGVRLGDYSNGKAKKHFFQGDNNYYNAAMKVISERIENPQFIIFTNNVHDCKEKYRFDYPVVYRTDCEFINDYEELQVMRSCKHAIIPGSTFHWWGAWLIENPFKVVVRPPKWFIDDKPIDINPPEWITVQF